MKILLVNQFFWPDSAPTGVLLTDVARELSAQGHEVDVICGGRGYAGGDASPEPKGVTIHRPPSLPFARGVVGRVLSYASFLVTAFTSSLRIQRPDLVVTLTTPPLLSLLGTFLKYVRKSRHFIWEMDVYPDVAVALNVFAERGVLARISRVLGDFSRRRADGILVLGECMRDVILRHGVQPDKIHVAENWSDGGNIHPTPMADDGKLTLLYSGNFGMAHDVATIEAAMSHLRGEAGFEFIFAGGGFHHKPLQRRCEESASTNAKFRSYCPKAELARSLSEGDIGLVTQRNDCTGLVVPSKVYGIMAAARPLLFIGPKEATPGRIIERFACGWRVDCGDVGGLTQLLRHLAAHPEEVAAAGASAREAFLQNYDLAHGVSRIRFALEGAGKPDVISGQMGPAYSCE